jgi:hypothetical protein
MNRRQLIWLITICATTLLTPLILYFSIFHNGLSRDSSRWRDFATFIALFVTIVNMLLIGSISLITSRATAFFQERQLRPHIFISEGTKINTALTSYRTWQLTNSSSAPAINILVRFCFHRSTGDWTKWVICFSLKKDGLRELGWINFADVIEVCYSDLANRRWYLYRFADYIGQETFVAEQVFTTISNQARQTFFHGTKDIVTTNNLTEGLINHIAALSPESNINLAVDGYLRRHIQ